MKKLLILVSVLFFSMQSFASKWMVCTSSDAEKNMTLNINTLEDIELIIEFSDGRVERTEYNKVENLKKIIKISNTNNKSITVVMPNENYELKTLYKGKVTNRIQNLNCTFSVPEESDAADESNDSDESDSGEEEGSFQKAFTESFEANNNRN
ncbi:MAG: hypothetical protein ABL927_09930 [Bdellovibrionales bacterium]